MRIRISAKIHMSSESARHSRKEYMSAGLIYGQWLVDVLNMLADSITLVVCAELVM